MGDVEKQIGFDFDAGKARKEAGLDSVEEHNERFVRIMRQRAEYVAIRFGTVTSDDLRKYAKYRGLEPEHPNCWGSLIRGPRWVCVGRTKSKLKSNHAREIRVWALRKEDGK